MIMVGGQLRTLAVLAMVACIAGLRPATAYIESNFLANGEGWTASFGTVAWVSTGGNPGGYLKLTDTQANWTQYRAPAKFLGNLSSYNGGTFSFDVIALDNATPVYRQTGWVLFYDLDGATPKSYVRDFIPTGEPSPYNTWKTYSATLTWDKWTVDADHPAPPSEADWLSFLADVDGVTIIMDYTGQSWTEGTVTRGERAGLDNVWLKKAPSTATPELSTWALLACSGLAGFVLRRRRRA